MSSSVAPGRDGGGRGSSALRLLRVAVSVALLAWVVSRVEWAELAARLGHASWPDLAIFVGLAPVSVAVCVWKWKLLLAARGAAVPAGRLFLLYLVGQFWNQLLPSSVGGDVARAAHLRRDVSTLDAVGSILVERLTGLTALVFFGCGAVVASPELRGEPLLVAAVGVCAVGFVVLLLGVFDPRLIVLARRPFGGIRLAARLFDKVERVRAELTDYRRSPGVLLAALVLSAVFYMLSMVAVFFAARGLGYPLPPRVAALTVPVAQLVSTLPIGINGIGLTEWTYTAGFAALSAAPAVGVACSLLVRVRNMLWAAAGYALFVPLDERARGKTPALR